MIRLPVLLASAAALAGCGLRQPLAPAEGQRMPAAPAMASRAMTTDELLAPPTIARPERLDELLQRSEERPDDRFDLPPGDVPAGNGAAAVVGSARPHADFNTSASVPQ